MEINTTRLRELAEKATPGPWSAIGSAGYVQAGDGHPRHTILAVAYGHDGNHQFNAPGSRENGEYIAAANPATMTALLSALESKEAEVQRLREALTAARDIVQQDRLALVSCHGIDGHIPAGDTLGTTALAEYDAALCQINAALSGPTTNEGA